MKGALVVAATVLLLCTLQSAEAVYRRTASYHDQIVIKWWVFILQFTVIFWYNYTAQHDTVCVWKESIMDFILLTDARSIVMSTCISV